jgi:hypothetical protein
VQICHCNLQASHVRGFRKRVLLYASGEAARPSGTVKTTQAAKPLGHPAQSKRPSELPSMGNLLRVALDSAKGTSTHEALSRAQSAALVQLISEATLTPVEQCDLMTLVTEVSWFKDVHLAKVTAALEAPEASIDAMSKRRRPQQEWPAFLDYGTEHMWTELGNPRATPNARLHVILTWAGKLGLRCPSEPTLKLLTCVWLASVHSKEALLGFDFATKYAFYKYVKKVWVTLRKNLAAPTSYAETLPANVMEFMRDHRDMWEQAAGGELPVACPLDVGMIHALNQSFGCRGGSTKVQPMVVATGQPGLSSVPTLAVHSSPTRGMGSLERMAEQFMSQMNSMAASQQRILEMVLSQSSGGVNLRSMAAIANESAPLQHALSRRPTLALMPAVVEELADEPEDVGDDGDEVDAEVEGGGAATVAMPSAQAISAKGPSTFKDNLSEMLDALDARKKEKVAAAKAAKKAKKQAEQNALVAANAVAEARPAKLIKKAKASDSQPPAVAEGTPAKASKKAKGTSASSAAVSPLPAVTPAKTSKASDSQPPAVAEGTPAKASKKAKGTSASSAAVSPLPAVTPAKTSKKAKGDVKAAKRGKKKGKSSAGEQSSTDEKKPFTGKKSVDAGTSEVPLILGCSKCRNSVGGCGQCRNPGYNGHRWNPTCPCA